MVTNLSFSVDFLDSVMNLLPGFSPRTVAKFVNDELPPVVDIKKMEDAIYCTITQGSKSERDKILNLSVDYIELDEFTGTDKPKAKKFNKRLAYGCELCTASN